MAWKRITGGEIQCEVLCCFYMSSLDTNLPSTTRSHCPGGEHWDFTAASGRTLWAWGLLVPVCGLELSRHHKESEGLCAHRMWVSAWFSEANAVIIIPRFWSWHTEPWPKILTQNCSKIAILEIFCISHWQHQDLLIFITWHFLRDCKVCFSKVS